MDDHIEPRPKTATQVSTKNVWTIASLIEAPQLDIKNCGSVVELLAARSTERSFSPLTLNETLGIVRLAMRASHAGLEADSGRLRKKMISAGALHPIEVLVVSGPEVSSPVVYLDGADAFGELASPIDADWSMALRTLNNVAPRAAGHFLLLVGDLRHVDQVYENPASLLWRDAGAVLQTFSLLASAMGYSFLPLGHLGYQVLNTLDPPHPDYVAVGTAVIGRSPSHIDGSCA